MGNVPDEPEGFDVWVVWGRWMSALCRYKSKTAGLGRLRELPFEKRVMAMQRLKTDIKTTMQNHQSAPVEEGEPLVETADQMMDRVCRLFRSQHPTAITTATPPPSAAGVRPQAGPEAGGEWQRVLYSGVLSLSTGTDKPVWKRSRTFLVTAVCVFPGMRCGGEEDITTVP
jgi:hypothetical protein